MSSSKPIIVLIPGAFHRPSSWRRVTEGLRSQGFTVLAPPLAVCGDATDSKKFVDATVTDDVKIIHSELQPLMDQGKEAVLVSHSYGSLPGSVAVEGQTVEERAARGLKGGIKAIVTISGFAFPVSGKSIMGDDSEPPVMPYHILEDGILHLQEAAKALWYNDLDAEGQDAAWEDLNKAQSRASFCYFPTFITSQIKIPKTYVLCEKDTAIEPSYQEVFLQIGKYDNVVRLPSGHAPMLSMPDKVVDILVDVAGK